MLVSRFRHTQATVSKPDTHFLGLSSSQALWAGSNMIACNEQYVAVPWSQAGSTAVFTHQSCGKVSANPPVLIGHEGPVIGVQFNPFDSSMAFTASEDGRVMGWRIPEGGLKANCSEPIVRLKAHDKKCGTIVFHPSASNVLASAGLDKTIKIWDLTRENSKTVIDFFEDYPMDISWNLDGTRICAVAHDKSLTVMDSRSGTRCTTCSSHDSARALRCVWAKRQDQIITFGWNRLQCRQMSVWDPRKLGNPISIAPIDQGSSAMMPMFDEDLGLMYVGFKGEGAIRAYELIDGRLVPSHQQLSSNSVKGVCLFPKQCLNVKQCEIARIYMLTQSNMMMVHMNLPRKQSDAEFQRDVYPPSFASEAAITAGEFFNDGKSAAPRECDLEYLFNNPGCLANKPCVTPPESEAFGVKLLNASAKTDLRAAPLHVDPAAVTIPEAPERDDSALEGLMALLEKQRTEVDELRRQITEKEMDMMATLQKIQEVLRE